MQGGAVEDFQNSLISPFGDQWDPNIGYDLFVF